MVKNWKLIVSCLLGLLVIGAFFYKQRSNYADQLAQLQKTNEEAIQKIEAARKDEQEQNKKTIAQYESTLNDISSRYQQALKDLDKEKKKRQAEILADKSPAALAKKLSESMNFKVTQ